MTVIFFFVIFVIISTSLIFLSRIECRNSMMIYKYTENVGVLVSKRQDQQQKHTLYSIVKGNSTESFRFFVSLSYLLIYLLFISFIYLFIYLAGHVSRMGERSFAYRLLVGNPEGRRPLGRPTRRLEDNIEMDVREMGWEYGLDRSGSGYGQVADSCECGNELSDSIYCGEILEHLRTSQLLRKVYAPWSIYLFTYLFI